MAIRHGRLRIGCVVGWLMALVWAMCLFYSAGAKGDEKPSSGLAVATQPAEEDMALLHLSEFREMVKAAGQSRYIYVASFESRFDSSKSPMTRCVNDPDAGRLDLIIDGEVKIIKTVSGKAAPGGHVYGRFKDVDLNRIGLHGARDTLARFRPLIDNIEAGEAPWSEGTKPKSAVFIGDANTTGLLEGAIFGPVPKGMVEDCVLYLEYITKSPVARTSRKDASSLLKSENVFMILGGVCVLDALAETGGSLLTPDEFFTAAGSSPLRYVNLVIDAMTRSVAYLPPKSGSPEAAAWASRLVAFMKVSNPPRQAVVMKWINKSLASGYCGVDRWLLPPASDFRDAIAGIVEERKGEEQWKEVVAEYRKTLRLLKEAETKPAAPSP